MEIASIKELVIRLEDLEVYLGSIGKALKKKGMAVRDAVRIHEKHQETVKLIHNRLHGISEGDLVCNCPLNSLQTSINCPLHGEHPWVKES